MTTPNEAATPMSMPISNPVKSGLPLLVFFERSGLGL
jgi:hypothetical protein